MDCIPTRAFFRPGEHIQLEVAFDQPVRGTLEATIFHLADTVATWQMAIDGPTAVIEGTVSSKAPAGYGVFVRWLDTDGLVRATASTAFDVLECWTQAPRYGFLSEFGPDRHNEVETMRWATRYHLNGLQYYDWQYRHETLVPPTDLYADLLGRRLSLKTIARLIEAGHSRGIAAMPYTTAYAASDAFFLEHPDWALVDTFGRPLRLGEAFLVIMNPAPGTPWSLHLLDEFANTLKQVPFDGIHIDQYGPPFVGIDAQGHPVDLAKAFPALIDSAAALVHEQRGAAGTLIFNAVGNWPVDTVACADEDVIYIEVWPPYRDFLDLGRIVNHAQQIGSTKRVVLAAYIEPARVVNWRLADAIIFASGGYHLELGEPGVMLSDPYFPKFKQLDPSAWAILGRYYDFLVRYGEVLGTRATAAPARARTLTISDHPQVIPIARQGAGFDSFSLINLTGLPHHEWDTPLSPGPTLLANLDICVEVEAPVARIWWASPDGDDLAARPVSFDRQTDHIYFQIPHLEYWNLIVLEYGP